MISKSLKFSLHISPSPMILTKNRTMRTAAIQPLVIVLTGATSVGKSAVANELCRIIDAEIVIADSVQVYKHLDIGANKPTKSDQQLQKHHLVDVFDPSDDDVNAEVFCVKATDAINDIISRNKTPIVVGGSTMWVQWLVHGKPDAPVPTSDVSIKAREMLKEAEKEKNWQVAVDIVRDYDPVRVAKLPKNDWYRLRRYLEVGLSLQNIKQDADDSDASKTDANNVSSSESRLSLTGERTFFLHGKDVRCFFLGEKREDLYRTIDDRCEDMLTGGLIGEVASLLQNEVLRPEYTVSKAIGYRQTIDYLLRRGRQERDSKLFSSYMEEFAAATRQYAKRQLAWYRKDSRFLCLRINRKASSSSSPDPLLPYIAVCDEILHWVQQAPESFASQVQRQIEQGLESTRLMTIKYFPRSYEITSDLERRIMCRMICEGTLKMPIEHNSSDDSKKVKKASKLLVNVETPPQTADTVSVDNVSKVPEVPFNWVVSILDPAQGVTPAAMAEIMRTEEISQWTADEPDIRMPESANKKSKMKEYCSIFSTVKEVERRYGTLIREADELSRALQTNNPELVERFRLQNENSVTFYDKD